MNRYVELENERLFCLGKANGSSFQAWVEATKICGLPYLIFAPTGLNPQKIRGFGGLSEFIEDEVGVTGDWAHRFHQAYVRLCFEKDTDQMLVKLALNGCYDNPEDWLNRP